MICYSERCYQCQIFYWLKKYLYIVWGFLCLVCTKLFKPTQCKGHFSLRIRFWNQLCVEIICLFNWWNISHKISIQFVDIYNKLINNLVTTKFTKNELYLVWVPKLNGQKIFFRNIIFNNVYCFKGCACYIFIVCFVCLKESTCETRKSYLISF